MTLHLSPPAGGLAALGASLLQANGDRVRGAANDPGFANPGVWQPMMALIRAAANTPSDAALFGLQARFDLTDAEVLCTALAARLEIDPDFTTHAQTLGATGAHGRLQVAALVKATGLTGDHLLTLVSGRAVGIGLLVLGVEDAPLPARSLSIPLPVLSALTGRGQPADTPQSLYAPQVRFTHRQQGELAEAAKWAQAGPRRTILLRGADLDELRAAAQALAQSICLTAFECDPHSLPSPAFLALKGALPVVVQHTNSGEHPTLAPSDTSPPLVILADAESPQPGHPYPVREWYAQTLSVADRADLWRSWGVPAKQSSDAAHRYRQGAGAIARAATALGNTAKRTDTLTRIAQSVATGGNALDTLAQRTAVQDIPRDALVLPQALLGQIDLLRARILAREELAEGLGPAITARYRPGVRALMTGESGTGKTLAAHWLASRLGLPLYRADMAALTSKWIGETEKNLSRLLALAETTDCILFFDEADALFGARTDVTDANDRHANAQTNFLLQRIEDFDGIALLSTNSRDRFDRAFVRRLDAILDFPLPDAAARAGLWQAHLGDGHALPEGAIERLAQEVELAGGHIRNAALGASLRARLDGEPISMGHIAAALDEECDKLGHPRPGPLAR